jgi:hypothetical protein
MMGGSFLDAMDLEYTGDLDAGVQFPKEKLIAGLEEIRIKVFEQRALLCLAKNSVRP